MGVHIKFDDFRSNLSRDIPGAHFVMDEERRTTTAADAGHHIRQNAILAFCLIRLLLQQLDNRTYCARSAFTRLGLYRNQSIKIQNPGRQRVIGVPRQMPPMSWPPIDAVRIVHGTSSQPANVFSKCALRTFSSIPTVGCSMKEGHFDPRFEG